MHTFAKLVPKKKKIAPFSNMKIAHFGSKPSKFFIDKITELSTDFVSSHKISELN